MLIIDGIVMEMLEVYSVEKINVIKLLEELVLIVKEFLVLNLLKGIKVIDRKILL